MCYLDSAGLFLSSWVSESRIGDSVTGYARVLNDSSWRELGQAASSQLLRDAKKDLFWGLQLYLAETSLSFTKLRC